MIEKKDIQAFQLKVAGEGQIKNNTSSQEKHNLDKTLHAV